MKNPTLNSTFITNAAHKTWHLLILVLILLSSITLSAQQQGSFVLAIPGQNLNFLNSNRTLITNTGNNGLNAGSVWRYDNLITTNGITIYGILTIKEISGGASIAVLDDETANSGLATRFQPKITTTSAGGSVLFELEFYEVITNNRAYISEYYFSAADIDGSELVEIGGYSNYQIDTTSGLTISQQPSGRTRFGGISGDLNGIVFENTAAFIAYYKFPYTKVSFALGKTNAGSQRQFSLQFGTSGGTFTNTTSVRNPIKLMYITKEADTDYFVAGTTKKYTVTLDNIGSTSENVTLTDPLPAGITYIPNSTTISVPAVSVNENVADNFNSTTYTRNNGTALWVNDWTEIGETTNPASGSIRVNSNKLNFTNLSNGIGIERTVNLNKVSNATLSFSYDQTGTTGALDIQVSPNGSTYYSIGTISGTGNNVFTSSINASYLTSDTRIRFVNSNSTNWSNKTINIDDVVIQYTLSQPAQNKNNSISGGNLISGTPSNIIVSGDNITLLPGAKATITYDVTVNCDAVGTIINTATASTPGLYETTISASHTAYVNPVNVTNASRCNAGSVTLSVSGAQGNQEYRWYSAATGGSPLFVGSSFTTPSISNTTTYYVSFYNPDTGCETGRTPVEAIVTSSNIIGNGAITSASGTNGSSGNTATTSASNNATNNNASGNTAWSNLGNIISSNNSRTNATNITSGNTSHYLDIPFPSLTIPTGNFITGITINIERNSSIANTIQDNVIQLLVNNIVVGENKALNGVSWPTTDASMQYGGINDSWSVNWLNTDIINAKLRIQVRNAGSVNATANIDHVTFTIHYGSFGDDQSSVNFKISGITGATGYTWTVPTGATITSGQGTNSILVNFNNAGQSGNYNVCATPTNPCITSTQICRTISITNNVNNEISGTVYNDQNGSAGSQKVDGIPISKVGGLQLYAVLTSNTSPYNAISSITIAPDGTYKFSYLPSTSTNAYRIYIKTTPYGDGISVSANSDLPAGAIFNGAIDNNDTNSLTGGSTTNGYLAVTAGNNTNNTNVNFGIAVSNPTGNTDNFNGLEDAPATFNILTNDIPVSGSLNAATVDLDPSTPTRDTSFTTVNGLWTVNNTGIVTFVPVADFFGTDSISYTVTNTSGYISNPTNITVNVLPVNDAPSFTKGADQSHSQTSTANQNSVSGWATNIYKGPSNESTQSVTFIVSNNNNSLFSSQPVILPNGQLQYTIAANAYGTATVSVYLKDDGGTANGGIDSSTAQTFTITVDASFCYKPPVINLGVNHASQHGITSFSRAGSNNGNWPMIRESAWMVLESKEKGFVINRIPTTAALSNITNPIIGMMVYDMEANCLKIYAIKSGTLTPDWYCFETQACPD